MQKHDTQTLQNAAKIGSSHKKKKVTSIFTVSFPSSSHVGLKRCIESSHTKGERCIQHATTPQEESPVWWRSPVGKWDRARKRNFRESRARANGVWFESERRANKNVCYFTRLLRVIYFLLKMRVGERCRCRVTKYTQTFWRRAECVCVFGL